MLYDVEFDWAIAIGILIGLSLFLSYISEERMSLLTIFLYMNIVGAFLASTGILPLWIEVLFLLCVVGLTILQRTKDGDNVIAN